MTPDEAKSILTLPCLQILLGNAQPVFPTRNRGNWSPLVRIIPVKRNSSGIVYPVIVDGKQWQTCVVPVLKDPQWTVTDPLMSTSLFGGDPYLIVEAFGNALRESFQLGGYGPRG